MQSSGTQLSDAPSPRRLLQPFVLSEKTKAHAPHQPRYPSHPNMRPGSRQWVDGVRTLADQVDAALRDAHVTRQHDELRRQQLARALSGGESAVDAEVTARLHQTTNEMRQIAAALQSLQNEMALLLAAREKAMSKVASVEKPLKLIQKRIDARTSALPNGENFHDSVERSLHLAATNMREAAAKLSGHVVKAEGLTAHMNNLRIALESGLSDKQSFSTLNEKCYAKEVVSGETFHELIALRSTAGGSGDSLPPLPATARRNPRVPKGDIPWAIKTASAAVGESAVLRMQIAAASKGVDRTVGSSVDAVEAAFAQKLRDAATLRAVLDDKIAAVRAELAGIETEQRRLRDEAERFVFPLESALHKNSARRAAAPIREVKGFDPIKDATADEVRQLRSGHAEFRRHMAHLDAQHERATALLRELEAQRRAKDETLQVDSKVMNMVATPAPPGQSVRSSRRADSSTSERSASQRSTTRGSARGV